MQRGHPEFERLLDLIYQSATEDDPDHLLTCIREISDALGAVGPGLGLGVGEEGILIAGLDIEDARRIEWAEHYANPLQQLLRQQTPGVPFAASALPPAPLLDEFMNDWAKPQGFRDLLQGHSIIGSKLYGLGVLKESRSQGVSEADLRLMNDLMPHLARALDLRERIAPIRSMRDLALAAMDRLGLGLVFFGNNLEVLEMSQQAESILSAGDGIWIDKRRLVLSDIIAHRRTLESLSLLLSDSSNSGETIRIQRPSGKTPFEIMLSRLPSGSFQFGSRGTAHIAGFLTDLEKVQLEDTSALESLYGLTRAESQIALRLAYGHGLEEIAEERGCSVATVRNQVKAVREKTGTSRQAELVSLILRGVSRLS